MKLRAAISLLAVSVSGATVATGCAARDSVTRDDLSSLEDRIAQLEQTNGRLRIRLQDTEEQLFLLQDRVEANRINVARRDASLQAIGRPQGGLITPDQAPPERRYESPVTSNAGPPRPDVDPLRQLPVQRLQPDPIPAAEIPPAPPIAETDSEVVIDQAFYDARFGSAPASATRPVGVGSSARSSVTGNGPRAQPPVDVGGARLPVVPVPTTVAAAAPGPSAPAPSEESRAVPLAATNEAPLAVYRRAVDQFNNAEYEASLGTLQQFVQMGPEPDYMDNALFWMGESLYGLGRYDEALRYFQRVVSEYPDGNKVPHALLKEALTWERLDNLSRARDVLSALVETYPTDEAADRARQRLRDLN
ncbi:MAG: tol-pal system protein YbgF [Myxococcales bacterium]|nr:tol-pal system protein YbgF [Myxococcales bacterium]MCB9531114.1 tol-pal system protein YbgF [Myxococcales bacterium]MCB9533024.1 tol-pal system protein YbgF [Myxococcales bacterium]